MQQNELIRARYEMGPLQRKLLYLLIKQLTPQDPPNKKYVIDITPLRDEEGKALTFESLEKVVYPLRFHIYKIKDTSGGLLMAPLVTGATYYKDGKKVSFVISDKMLPYLLDLKLNSIGLLLEPVFYLKHKYGQQLYEMMSQYKNEQEEVMVSVADLRYHLRLENTYTGWTKFEEFVLRRPCEEIAQNTDMIVDYSVKKTGKKNTHILFKIHKKAQQLHLGLT